MKLDNTRKITKKEWYRLGGLSNPNCWRKMVGGSWKYYYTTRP